MDISAAARRLRSQASHLHVIDELRSVVRAAALRARRCMDSLPRAGRRNPSARPAAAAALAVGVALIAVAGVRRLRSPASAVSSMTHSDQRPDGSWAVSPNDVPPNDAPTVRAA